MSDGPFDRLHHPGTIHHAPWSRRFKTMCYAGAFAYEIQIGRAVIQWFYEPWEDAPFGRHLHVWKDRYWR